MHLSVCRLACVHHHHHRGSCIVFSFTAAPPRLRDCRVFVGFIGSDVTSSWRPLIGSVKQVKLLMMIFWFCHHNVESLEQSFPKLDWLLGF